MRLLRSNNLLVSRDRARPEGFQSQVGSAGLDSASVDLRRRCYNMATNVPFGIKCQFRPACRTGSEVTSITRRPGFAPARRHCRLFGALGGTRTPTILLTATSRQRVYQFRHERLGDRRGIRAAPDQDRINGADVTNQGWGDKACRRAVSDPPEYRFQT
jgi:hypothetical protein